MSETARLSKLVADFGEAMREKLWRKQKQGRAGWNDDSDSSLPGDLRDALEWCVKRYLSNRDDDQLVDIANFAAMLWNLKQLEGKKGK